MCNQLVHIHPASWAGKGPDNFFRSVLQYWSKGLISPSFVVFIQNVQLGGWSWRREDIVGDGFHRHNWHSSWLCLAAVADFADIAARGCNAVDVAAADAAAVTAAAATAA